tara:strand:- start:4184 stop:4693 length:510 start_codon:yes stop_codon:yes gene_type:complete
MLEGPLLLILYAYFGFFVGYILTRISPEEMGPGKRYFKLLALIMLLLIGIFGVFVGVGLNNMGIELAILLVFGMLVGKFFSNIYFVLGVGMGFALEIFSLILASLIFVFAMADTSLKYGKSLFQRTLFFIVPALLVYFLNIGKFFDPSYIVVLVSGFSWAYAYKSLLKR